MSGAVNDESYTLFNLTITLLTNEYVYSITKHNPSTFRLLTAEL